jgi:hypothetical protein
MRMHRYIAATLVGTLTTILHKCRWLFDVRECNRRSPTFATELPSKDEPIGPPGC